MSEEFEGNVEEATLSAEELFEMHKAEINAAFEEKSLFRRLGDMCKGLSKPKSSPEYKLAKVELQRLAAPLCAILLPTLGVIALIVITAISGQTKETIQVDIARVQEVETELEEEKEVEIEEPPPPEEAVDVQVDTPVVGPVSDTIAPATAEPVSVKPAPQDSVALIKSPVTMKSMAGSRSPGMRGRFLGGGAGYGDAMTEASVMKALRWLKKTQNPNGSWSKEQPLANTGLAVLTFLAHGETPASPEFGATVEKAMQFLVDSLITKKDRTGQTVPSFKGADRNEYATLIGTYALCESFGMTKNPNTKQVAMKTLKRIIDNQSPTGGWDYGINKSSTRDDMSFAGWALQALKAGKMAGMHPEGLDECIRKAIRCLKTRNFRNGGFNYTAGGRPTGLTATGCLCMQLLGYRNEPEVKAALETMRAWLPAFSGSGKGVPLSGGLPGPNPQYYCYYASQCKYQAGMCGGATPANVKSWQAWNQAMKRLYPTSMTPAGTIPGVDGKPKEAAFWKYRNEASYCRSAGNTYTTCLCALQLMVYYRYLPTTQLKAGEASSSEADEAKKAAKDVDVEVDI